MTTRGAWQAPMKLDAALAPEYDPTGYRAFRVRVGTDGRFELYAATDCGRSPVEYPNGRAFCRRCGPERFSEKCTCGFYAYKEEGGAATYAANTARLMVEVRGYGTVHFHEHGWRAEYMQILRFYWPLCYYCDQGADLYYDARHTLEAETYRVIRGRRRGQLATRMVVKDGGFRMVCAEHARDPQGQNAYTPIDGLVRDVAERFSASVYDRDATKALIEKNPEWKAQVAERNRETWAAENAHRAAVLIAREAKREAAKGNVKLL